MHYPSSLCSRFLYPAPAPPRTYTLSLHDALPISRAFERRVDRLEALAQVPLHVLHHHDGERGAAPARGPQARSEEHTSELQSRFDLVCRLLLEKKKKTTNNTIHSSKTSPMITTSA